MYLLMPELSLELSLSNCLLDISTRMSNKPKTELVSSIPYKMLYLQVSSSPVNGNIIFLLAQAKHSESSLTPLFLTLHTHSILKSCWFHLWNASRIFISHYLHSYHWNPSPYFPSLDYCSIMPTVFIFTHALWSLLSRATRRSLSKIRRDLAALLLKSLQ